MRFPTCSSLAKLAVAGGLAGAMALGSYGVAGATSTSSSTPSINCSQAAKRIQATEAKLAKLEPQVSGWVTQVQQDGLPRVAKRIQRLDARVKKVEGRLQQRQQKIQAACPSPSSSSGG